MNSNFFKLNKFDFLKGAITAAFTAGGTALLQALNVGHIPAGKEWSVICISAAAAFIAYLLKNAFTNSDGKIGPER
jgi:hypothetical protein